MAPPGVCVAIEVPCTWPCFVHKLKGNVCAAKCMASGPSFVKSFLKPEKKIGSLFSLMVLSIIS